MHSADTSVPGLYYYHLVVILGALTAMGPLAIDMYLPTFPSIARDLAAPQSAVQVTVAVYFIGLAVGQALYGPLSDRLGRKRPLYLGLVLFSLASMGCAMATSIRALIVLRVVQALGGCAQLVVARAVVRDVFPPREAIRVLSLLLLVMGLAPILAPFFGGQLLVRFGWRSVFWVLAAYGALGLLAVIFWLPESLPAPARQRHGLGEMLRVYGMLLRDPLYMSSALAGSLMMGGMFAYIAASPFVFIELFDVAPERYGLYFGTNALGITTSAQINGWLAHRVNPVTILRMVLQIASMAAVGLLLNAYTGFGGFAGILIPLFVFVASIGFVLPNTTVLAMAPHGRVAGSASALLGTLQFFFGAVAGALVSSLGNGTAVPLGFAVFLCAVSALLTFQLLPRLTAAAVVPSASSADPTS